ncbi:MAG: carboxymuconolactone decarboxylase family protein [Bacteroidota bacterium]
MSEFTETLMRGENSLSRGERELIATVVSSLNDCFYCENSHGGVAQHLPPVRNGIHRSRGKKISHLPTSLIKMKALLAIAASVQKGGKHVTELKLKLQRTLE